MTRTTAILAALFLTMAAAIAEEAEPTREVTFGAGPTVSEAIWPSAPRPVTAVPATTPTPIRRPTTTTRPRVTTRPAAVTPPAPSGEPAAVAPPAPSEPRTAPTPQATAASAAPQQAPAAALAAAAAPLPTTVVPDLIPPAAFDALAPDGDANEAASGNPDAADAPAEATAEDAFTSRREVLGQPSSIVPTVDAQALTPPADRRSGAAGWYKIVAGACFLGAILMIGARYSRRPRGFDERERPPAGGWLPPRREKASRDYSSRREEAALLTRSVAGDRPRREFPVERGRDLWRDEPIARRADDGTRRRRNHGAPSAAQGGGFVFEALTPSPNRTEPEFHDAIERRVRRHAAAITHDLTDDGVPRRRPSARDEEFSLVKELAEDGLSTRDIARRLAIPEGEVDAVLQLR